MDWQRHLGRESIYFVLTVVICFLFWFALAAIVEQHIIAPEYLYSREKNGFMLTLLVFYFIRLNGWMINRTEYRKNDQWKTKDRIVKKNETTELHTEGDAKEHGGKMKERIGQEWMVHNRRQKAQENGSLG